MIHPLPDDSNALLLPFYVNGTLGADERAALERALAQSPDLRAELAETEAIAAMVRAGGAGLSVGPASGRDRLENLLGAIRSIQRRKVQPIAGRHGLASLHARRSPSARSPARWAMPIAASLALALVGFAAILTMRDPGEATYRTASGTDTGSSAAGEAMLYIRLNPEARWADVEALLDRRQLSIISGPRDGVLTVRLDDPAGNIEKVRVELAASPMVSLAGLAK